MSAIYGNMDPINIPPMLAYIPYMDPMSIGWKILMFKKVEPDQITQVFADERVFCGFPYLVAHPTARKWVITQV